MTAGDVAASTSADAVQPSRSAVLANLLLRVQGGDQTAFAALYDHLAPTVFGVVQQVLRSQALAEEVTQEVFVELWRQAPRYDPQRGAVTTWVTTIARRRAIDRVRREESQLARVRAVGAQGFADDDDAADVAVAQLSAGRVRDAVASLPSDQRRVVHLAFLEGYSHSTIAETLGLPLGTVKSRVRGALMRLSAILEDQV
jgi:RNA polymerase sigma-70 factor, ECF subfamily